MTKLAAGDVEDVEGVTRGVDEGERGVPVEEDALEDKRMAEELWLRGVEADEGSEPEHVPNSGLQPTPQ